MTLSTFEKNKEFHFQIWGERETTSTCRGVMTKISIGLIAVAMLVITSLAWGKALPMQTAGWALFGLSIVAILARFSFGCQKERKAYLITCVVIGALFVLLGTLAAGGVPSRGLLGGLFLGASAFSLVVKYVAAAVISTEQNK